MDFGSQLRESRKKKRLTQQQLADAVGVHFTYVSKIENGLVSPPSEETIRKMADALDTDAEALLVLAAKVGPELKKAASEEPRLALLLRTIGQKPPSPNQYDRMLEILKEDESQPE